MRISDWSSDVCSSDLGFFKREGRPSEKETLVSRLIDRPIRPLFVKGFKNETQVICTVLAHDLENDPDIVAMVGASAALRSEEHTSELQSLMRISYAVFCLKKKTNQKD